MLQVGISPGIFLLFCMAVCDYASLVTGYGCLWLRVSCQSNPADSECVLLNDCDKRNQGTPEVATFETQSLVFHLQEPISSLFSIWHILLIQFQLNLSNHFRTGWYIYNTGSTQAKQKSRKAGQLSQRGPRNGGMELCNVLNIKEYSENWGRKRSEKYFEPPIIAKLIYIVRLSSLSAFGNIPVTNRLLLPGRAKRYLVGGVGGWWT
jgi:hypothetical protein